MSKSLILDLMDTLSESLQRGDVAETLISCRTGFRELQQQADDARERCVSQMEPATVREPGVIDNPAGNHPVEIVDDFFLNRLDEVVMWLVDFLEELSPKLGDDVLLGFVQELLIDLLADLLVEELGILSECDPFDQTEH